MTSFTLLLGGDFVPTSAIRRRVAGTRVIAADGGMRHAQALGIVPELWVGDFDSVPDDLPESLLSVPRQSFARDKDKTDGELAVEVALTNGATSLLMVGAFGGGRSDHEFLHLSMALRLATQGIPVMLTSGLQEGVPLLPGRAEFDYPEDTLFSIIAFSELSGLSVAGAKWPLDRVEVEFGSSLTLSNETRGRLSISLGSGRAMLIAHLNEQERD
ncbi:thiamine diphosphokinase [Pseudaminobacter sp. 19-2017]|uniref:Thiamine diphosphokinase n=1 Tax=Pseudaminobacter soli (ex Zhang et al. 2022) TaxID=2831468 RepID=A0A942I238_9HYPH|nr:thiamine diphosphokinase [Pseudaminobacter soli]MBS3647749.1 thiamine diphosphokinase [Pseudaminobacter soli]